MWATARAGPESARAEELTEQLHSLLERRSSAVRHGGFGEPLRIASALRQAWERSDPMPAVAVSRPWDAINAIWWARVDWPATAPYVLNDLADFAANACWTALGRARPLPPTDWSEGA